MTMQRRQLWAIAGAIAVVVAAIVLVVIIITAGGSGGSGVAGGAAATGTKHAPTGPFGKLLFTRIGFATNCSYVATVTLEPGGPALAQYGRQTHEPPSTESPATGPPHHRRTACLYDRYDPGVWYSSMLVMNGRQSHAGAIYTYYVPAPQAPAGSEVTIPAGMRMIATKYYFTCANEHTPAGPRPFDCRPSQPDNPRVTLWVNFPTCWNGTGLEPTDVQYPERDQGCPSGFDKRFPLIQVQMTWEIADGTGATFTTGDPFQVIFENFWVQEALDNLVTNCIKERQACGPIITYFTRTPLPT